MDNRKQIVLNLSERFELCGIGVLSSILTGRALENDQERFNRLKTILHGIENQIVSLDLVFLNGFPWLHYFGHFGLDRLRNLGQQFLNYVEEDIDLYVKRSKEQQDEEVPMDLLTAYINGM